MDEIIVFTVNLIANPAHRPLDSIPSLEIRDILNIHRNS